MNIQQYYIEEIASALLGGVILNDKESAKTEVMHLLKNVENINTKGRQGRTFLIHCCAYDYYDLAITAIAKGADINLQDNAGFSPLHIAVKSNDSALVKYLLKKGALPNIKNKYGNTPALDASRNWEILKLLLDYGCDIKCKNFSNVSAYDLIQMHPDVLAQYRKYTADSSKG